MVAVGSMRVLGGEGYMGTWGSVCGLGCPYGGWGVPVGWEDNGGLYGVGGGFIWGLGRCVWGWWGSVGSK